MKTSITQLPNGFALDGPGSPNTRDVEIRNLGGDDEDFIRDVESYQGKNPADKLLKDCIIRIGNETSRPRIEELYDNHFLLADMTFLLIALRRWTLGDKYTFEYPCAFCNRLSKHGIDLSTLEALPAPKESEGKLSFETKIGEHTIGFRPLLAKDWMMLDVIKKQHKKEKATRELALQLVMFDGKPKPSIEELKQDPWDWSFRNELRNAMDDAVGGINTELYGKCRECDKEFKFNMPMDLKSFFFPKGGFSGCQMARPAQSSGRTSSSSAGDSNGSLAKSEPSVSVNASST